MPRPLRIEFPGAIYHVMNRGDRREDIFRDDEDRTRFLAALAEACGKTSWQVHAYCLMRNHFHLVLETPQGNLVAGMKWLLGVYTKRFNIRHQWCGHLFAGRYKALIVEAGGGYLRTVCDYVHLNPVRARLIGSATTLERFVWSSYGAYLKAPQGRPDWLRVDRLLGEKGIPKDSAAGRREFAAQTERRRAQEKGADYGALRRGWCLGSEEFRKELMAATADRSGAHHFGGQRRESLRERAERIVGEEFKRLDCAEKEWLARRKGDKAKVALARRLRRETTMTYGWIAERLRMDSGGYVFNLLRPAVKQKV